MLGPQEIRVYLWKSKEVMKVKRSLSILISILVLSFATIAYGQNIVLQKTQDKKPESVIIFKSGMAPADLKLFTGKHKLKVRSITFQGEGFSCGGTVESVVQVEHLINQIIANWEDDLKQDKIPAEVKEQIKTHMELTKKGLLKAKAIKVEGDVSSDVEKDIRVQEVLHPGDR